jgi:hypothetical protein
VNTWVLFTVIIYIAIQINCPKQINIMLELWLAIHYSISKAVVDEARVVSPPQNIISDTCVTDLRSFVRMALYLHSSKRCFVSLKT